MAVVVCAAVAAIDLSPELRGGVVVSEFKARTTPR